MKVTINKYDILDALSKIQGLTGRKSNFAITENVLIKTADNSITLIATDLETGFEGFYPSTVESGGKIAINSRKFYEIVREFPNNEIVINEVENRWIEIGDENVLYHIVGMNPDDFPGSPQIEEIVFFEIDSLAFKNMIDKTVIITGPGDDKRAHITGVYFEIKKENDEKIIRIISTDGSRLSKVDYKYKKDLKMQSEAGIIIPKKGLTEVSKFLDTEGTAQIGFKSNHLIIKKDKETIIIRLLEGDFPEYKDIIVKDDAYEIKMEREPFLMMLKRMSILCSDDYRGVIFKFKDDKLLINVTNPNIGQSKEEININFQREAIEVAFNPKFFIEALNVIDEDKVIINIVNETRPCIIEAEKEKNYLSVIMPMRI
jgi:DNA polymerase-3 subunit beta